jgi:hypothetical protein
MKFEMAFYFFIQLYFKIFVESLIKNDWCFGSVDIQWNSTGKGEVIGCFMQEMWQIRNQAACIHV